jgi:hypothetical protein
MDRITSSVNSKLLTILYIIGFIISGSFSALCLITMGHSNLSKVLLIGMTITFEFAKGISFFEFLSGKHKKSVSRLWFFVWLILTGFSLFASTAFSMNETSKSKNETYVNSSAYESNIDEKERIEKLIENKEEQIEKAVAEKESTIKQMKKERDAFPESYINTRKEATEAITKYSKEQQVKIDEYSDELEELNKELNEKSNVVTKDYELESTTGYITILNASADFLNKSKIYINNEWTFEELELLFYFLLSFTLEIVICLFYYLKKYNEASLLNESNEKDAINIEESDNKEMQQSKIPGKVYKLKNKKIQFLPWQDEVSKKQSNENREDTKNEIKEEDLDDDKIFDEDPDDVKEYLNYVYSNKKGNLSPGQKKINDITGLSFRQIKNIRDLLEEKGIVKTDKKSTNLLVENLSEAMEKLDLEGYDEK